MLATIREYATERLTGSPHSDAVHLAHARFYAGYSSSLRESLQGPGREQALEGLSAEIGNLRTAWRYWVDAADLEQLYLLLDGLWALHYARGWYHAAVELTTDLLDVLASAEPSPDRDQEEVTLRTSLARALMAVRGYTPEVEEEFRRALAISGPAGSAANRFPVLRALSFYYMNLAEFSQSRELGLEMIEIAEKEHDLAMQVEAHFVYGSASAFTGDLPTGLRHLDRAIELFDPKMHGSGRFQIGTSPGVVSRTAAALLLWGAGYLDQAAVRASESIDLARSLAHPFSVAYSLYHVAFFEVGRGRFDAARELAKELRMVATENDYPVWRALASVIEGVALCAMGRPEEGLAMTEAGLELYQGLTTPPVFWPPLLSLRAVAFAMAGQPDRAVELINESIALGGEDDTSNPDFRLMRGDFLMMLPEPDVAGATASYRAAIGGSHEIGMRLVELQAATRLVALERSLGQEPDTIDELRRVYATFDEGLDEPVMMAARMVLDGSAKEEPSDAGR
jgi:tetratricopeptide (TPR) repeat protein